VQRGIVVNGLLQLCRVVNDNLLELIKDFVKYFNQAQYFPVLDHDVPLVSSSDSSAVSRCKAIFIFPRRCDVDLRQVSAIGDFGACGYGNTAMAS
jgi:hypothetical protein